MNFKKMDKEIFHSLLHRIKKSYPQFKTKYAESEKSNNTLTLNFKGGQAIIGWSHKQLNNLVFGIITDKKKLYELEEANYKDLKSIFERVEELLSMVEKHKNK